MRLPASSPILQRWPLLGLAVFFILVLAASALLWTSASPASGQDGHQPDPQVVDDVWDYARETDNGFAHVLRWMRVLHTLGELEDMTAAEAQENATQYWAERWNAGGSGTGATGGPGRLCAGPAGDRRRVGLRAGNG